MRWPFMRLPMNMRNKFHPTNQVIDWDIPNRGEGCD